MSEFVDYLSEVFEQFGAIDARRMFGGYGIYHDGVVFALVADDILYLKAGQRTRRFFEAQGLPRFAYERAGRTIAMSYYLAPEEIFDDPETAALWADRAWEAARETWLHDGRSGRA